MRSEYLSNGEPNAQQPDWLPDISSDGEPYWVSNVIIAHQFSDPATDHLTADNHADGVSNIVRPDDITDQAPNHLGTHHQAYLCAEHWSNRPAIDLTDHKSHPSTIGHSVIFSNNTAEPKSK